MLEKLREREGPFNLGVGRPERGGRGLPDDPLAVLPVSTLEGSGADLVKGVEEPADVVTSREAAVARPSELRAHVVDGHALGVLLPASDEVRPLQPGQAVEHLGVDLCVVEVGERAEKAGDPDHHQVTALPRQPLCGPPLVELAQRG